MLEAHNPVQTELMASALDWWVDAGVDTLVDEVPTGWLKVKEIAPAARPTAMAAPENDPVTLTLPADLPSYVHWLMTDADVPDAGPVAQRVGPSGDPRSDLMILIDMPDTADHAAGQLLSGEAGALFDRMLSAIDQTRDTVYLAAFTPGRAPGGMIPTEMADRLKPLLLHHIALVAPKKLWLMGQAVSRAILGADATPGHGRLRKFNHEGRIVDAVASYAPRFLLQQPKWKAGAWADMQALLGGQKE